MASHITKQNLVRVEKAIAINVAVFRNLALLLIITTYRKRDMTATRKPSDTFANIQRFKVVEKVQKIAKNSPSLGTI